MSQFQFISPVKSCHIFSKRRLTLILCCTMKIFSQIKSWRDMSLLMIWFARDNCHTPLIQRSHYRWWQHMRGVCVKWPQVTHSTLLSYKQTPMVSIYLKLSVLWSVAILMSLFGDRSRDCETVWAYFYCPSKLPAYNDP